MFNFNMWGITNTPVKPAEHKPPDKCDFCNKKIEGGDYYYGGYDSFRIYAETCDDIKCYQWLGPRKRGKKPYT